MIPSSRSLPSRSGTIGCVFSGGSLEHYSPEELDHEVARMYRVLRPGGIMSHVVDHRDHRWHADKRISPLQHLTLEKRDYLRRFGNPLEYHNRWLRSKYLDLFTRHGFEVECRDVRLYTPDLPPLNRNLLASPFREASVEDLRSLVTHFVAIRQ
jgi:SAM-dependent methyltransferase